MITGSELSGQWTVTHINAVPITDRANPTMTFDDDGTLSGDASCNNYSTTYVVEGDTVGLGPAIATTRKACVPEINDQETAFLAVLDQITSAPDADGDPATFAIDGDDLAITTAQGDTITATR